MLAKPNEGGGKLSRQMLARFNGNLNEVVADIQPSGEPVTRHLKIAGAIHENPYLLT